MTTLLATSVVRGAYQGQSHGGIYLVDLAANTVEKKLDWDNCGISFEGRGADRGLRGIAFFEGAIYIAASDEIFVFDKNFKIQASFRSRYLKHCHEICIYGEKLYLTSTGFDSLLVFDLITKEFTTGVFLQPTASGLRPLAFDPQSKAGPKPSNNLHLNSVSYSKGGLVICGRKLRSVFRLQGADISVVGNVPLGTHNAQIYEDGILFNDTENDQIVVVRPRGSIALPVPNYKCKRIENIDITDAHLARPSFARGMSILPKNRVASGASPSTITVYDLKTGNIEQSINISMDVRNAVHGLEIYPYS